MRLNLKTKNIYYKGKIVGKLTASNTDKENNIIIESKITDEDFNKLLKENNINHEDIKTSIGFESIPSGVKIKGKLIE